MNNTQLLTYLDLPIVGTPGPDFEPERLFRIIVLDDDPLFLQQFKKLAKRRGAYATVCASTAEYIEHILHGNFDAAILDYNLTGGRTGIEAATFKNGLPVVMISASTDWVEKYSELPKSVKTFVNKRDGINKIFESAVLYSGQPNS